MSLTRSPISPLLPSNIPSNIHFDGRALAPCWCQRATGGEPHPAHNYWLLYSPTSMSPSPTALNASSLVFDANEYVRDAEARLRREQEKSLDRLESTLKDLKTDMKDIGTKLETKLG